MALFHGDFNTLCRYSWLEVVIHGMPHALGLPVGSWHPTFSCKLHSKYANRLKVVYAWWLCLSTYSMLSRRPLLLSKALIPTFKEHLATLLQSCGTKYIRRRHVRLEVFGKVRNITNGNYKIQDSFHFTGVLVELHRRYNWGERQKATSIPTTVWIEIASKNCKQTGKRERFQQMIAGVFEWGFFNWIILSPRKFLGKISCTPKVMPNFSNWHDKSFVSGVMIVSNFLFQHHKLLYNVCMNVTQWYKQQLKDYQSGLWDGRKCHAHSHSLHTHPHLTQEFPYHFCFQ